MLAIVPHPEYAGKLAFDINGRIRGTTNGSGFNSMELICI